jgi:hypothetical protein
LVFNSLTITAATINPHPPGNRRQALPGNPPDDPGPHRLTGIDQRGRVGETLFCAQFIAT